ncbi:MAG: sulfatase-like hydrolase/transferase [Pirellulaceae bacterium]|nr:sulfatase-like hydrolase/transferase [Pirellulaceae bacterium]
MSPNSLALSLVLLGCAIVARAADRPNVVIIVADDLGYGELGSYGGTEIPTPHLDRLAAEGVRFTDAYVTAPYCAPSRAGLLTGRYPTRFGFEFNPVGASNADPAIGLPVGQRTLADHLRASGYVTGLVGKWHLGGTARFHPQRRGFDEFFGFLHEGHYYVPPHWDGHTTWLRRRALPDGSQGRWTAPDGRIVWTTHMGNFEPDYDADNPVVRGSQPVNETANLTDAFSREAEQFIARHQSQPFFLYLACSAVHSPLQGADEYMRKFAHIADIHRRIFAAMLAQLDDGIGRVLHRLSSEGIERQTLVVFLSDNGGATRELTSSNRPLRGEKGQFLEGGIRVPMIVRWPDRLPAGRTETRMASSLDLLPTVLAAAGAALPRDLDGVDLIPYLIGELDGPIRDRHYWQMGGRAALREGDWKIHRPAADRAWELYDLASDPEESRDLAVARPEQLARLVTSFQQLDAEMAEPAWGGPARPTP